MRNLELVDKSGASLCLPCSHENAAEMPWLKSQKKKTKAFDRGPIEHKLFFLKLFGHRRDIPAKSRDIPPKKFDFPWFRETYRTFWPPPFQVEDPYPTGKYPDSKVWVWVPFSCLV